MRTDIVTGLRNVVEQNSSPTKPSGQTVTVVGREVNAPPDGTYYVGVNNIPDQPNVQVGDGGNTELNAPSGITYSQELILPSVSSNIATVSLTINVPDVQGASSYDVYLVTA